MRIHQTLSCDTFKGNQRTLYIVIPQSGAGVIAKVKLIHIPLQMLRAYVMECTNKATFQDREITLNGIGCHLAPRIFFTAAINRFMRCVLLPGLAIDMKIVR